MYLIHMNRCHFSILTNAKYVKREPQLNARVTAHSVTLGVNLLILDTPAEILQPGLRGTDQGPARHGRVHQVGLGHTHQVLGPNVLHPADKVIDLS